MEEKERTGTILNQIQNEADRVEITYYTDPLCCWSWALEPQWRRLQAEYGNHVSWKYKMGGLLPDWKTYHDPEHSVSKPIQMGPVWMHAASVSGMPMNSKIWIQNAPASSYPACIAFKCVELQNTEAAEIYLRLLRDAIMIDGKNIADKTILIEIAQLLNTHTSTFDIDTFETDLVSETGIEAFRKDLLETQAKRVERFPTLIFRQGKQAMIMKGYHPYEHISAIMQKLIPGFAINNNPSLNTKDWLKLTPREMQEITR